jgi:two-component system, chemotaxis family, chemotaxis protein CheY
MSHAAHTILLVEDDHAIRAVMQMFFEEEGYSVILAENGQVALDQLSNSPQICLILLDLFMPVMNGAEFLDRIALMPGHPAAQIPVIVVSAAPPEGKMAVRVKARAKHFIKKPASLDQLAELVEQYCPRAS